jgi:GT2 family glycosyltransferase
VVWFIDSDCVAFPDALRLLLDRLREPGVAGGGGSYANVNEASLLACLIHEEIRERHLAMPGKVDYLGSFNVVYRRSVLEQVGGFDEKNFNAPLAPGAEDADLSYRIADLGHTLRFEPASQVAHYHPVRLSAYLRTQRVHGTWGARLYYRHRKRARGNSYSRWTDHLQPPLAVAALLALPALGFPAARIVFTGLAVAVAAMQAPLAVRIIRRTNQWRYALFVPLSLVRAGARGVGMGLGAIRLLWDRPEPARGF